MRERRRHCRGSHHRPYGGDEYAVATRGRRVQAVLRRALRDRLRIVVADVLARRIAILQARTRKNPLQIRMRQRQAEAALRTGSARPRRGARAKKRLAKPQREALFSDATRTVKEHAGWQSIPRNRAGDSLTESLVAIEIDDRHWDGGGRYAR